MPVIRCCGLVYQPRLVQHLDYLIWKRSFRKITQISLELLQAANANDDAVISIFDLQRRVMDAPPQRRFDQGQIVLFDDRLDQAESIKRCVLEISRSVHGTSAANGITEPT